nr:SRPBCC family protein [Cerasicoccus frondis]
MQKFVACIANVQVLLARQMAAVNLSCMDSQSVSLHRVYRASPEKVYRAFIDPDALTRWMAPYGFLAKVHHLDATVGGTFHMSFTNFSTGGSHSFGGEYLELIPGEKLRYTDKFDDPNLPDEMMVTVQFSPVICGTDVKIEQTGIPAVIPAAMCYLGWEESLAQLKLLVETDIPDEG